MNDSTFVIYTTETGGFFKIVKASEADYLAAVESGIWNEFDMDLSPQTVPVDIKMIAFLRVEQNHDFVLGGDRGKPETWQKAAA